MRPLGNIKARCSKVHPSWLPLFDRLTFGYNDSQINNANFQYLKLVSVIQRLGGVLYAEEMGSQAALFPHIPSRETTPAMQRHTLLE